MSQDNQNIRHFVIAITGASGSIYGLRLVNELLRAGCRVSLIMTEAGRQVLKHEVGLDWSTENKQQRHQVQEYFASIAVDCLDIDDFWAGSASGSNPADAVIIIPCSMGTAGRIAAGLSGNLLERAADVMLKERRELILVPRERHSTRSISKTCCVFPGRRLILPAMPGFYHGPDAISDLVDFVVGKVLDQLAVEHDLFERWGEQKD